MGKSNDSSYSEWDDKFSRKARKSDNRKQKKRMNSSDIMDRWSKGHSDDDDFYTDKEKFRGR